MTKTRAVCLYHDLREDFDEALALARHNSWPQCPKHLLKRTAMTVCSCRRSSEHRSSEEQLLRCLLDQSCSDTPVTTEALDAVWLGDSTISALVNTGSSVMNKCVAMARNGNESALRFLCLMKMGQAGDFRLLEEELIFSLRKSGQRPYESVSQFSVSVSGMTNCSEDEAKSGDTDLILKNGESSSKVNNNEQNPYNRSGKKKRFAASNIKYILRKRKRQADYSSCVHLPIFGGNVTYLQRDPSIGDQFQTVSKCFKPCVVQVRYAETGQMMQTGACKTVISVWCKKKDARDLHSFLYKKAEDLQTAITTRWKQSRALIKFRRPRAYYSRDDDEDIDIFDDPQSRKETRWNDFGKKRFADRREKQRKGKRGLRAFYRCFNCLAEKTSAGDRSCPKMCKFHPGFLHEQRWTCCGQSHAEKNDVGQNHAGQGHVGRNQESHGSMEQIHVGQSHVGWNHRIQDHVGQGHHERGMSIHDHHRIHGCMAVESHDWRYKEGRGNKLPKETPEQGSTLYFPTARKGRRHF